MSQQVEGMSCETALDLIEAFLDDELGPTVAEEFRAHLNTCPDCAKEAADARNILTELRSLPELDLPARVVTRVKTVVDRESTDVRGSFGSRKRMVWLAAAAAVVLAIGAVSLSRHQPSSTDLEAQRAAAEVTYALACVSGITQRANQLVQARVIDDGAIQKSIRGLARSLGPLKSFESTDGTRAAPYEPTHEGSS